MAERKSLRGVEHKLSPMVLLASGMGNVLEWSVAEGLGGGGCCTSGCPAPQSPRTPARRFDFSIFGYFAPEIGAAFFPPSDPTIQLMEAFAVFGGACVWGPC